MKQSSTPMSPGRAFRSKTGRSWPVNGVSLQMERGTPAPLRRASVKPLQFQVEESVRDGLARISGELIRRALARIDCGGRNRAEDLHQVRVTIKRLRALLRLV